jgi:hypothetical protein
MGWTSFSMHESIKEWFKKKWKSDNRYKVLDSALVKRNTMYGAIKNIETNEIFCAIFLIRWSNNYCNFSYKDMTEFVSPCEIECPERIMKLLTPLNDKDNINDLARKWRNKVYNYWNIQKKLNSGKYLIKTNTPIKFSNGLSFNYFKKIGKKYYAGELQTNNVFASFCCIRRFNPRYYQYELVNCL